MGQFVAITGKKQADSSMLAGDLRISSEPGASAPPGNQFPMDAGNTMTNAPIKALDANGMTVTLPGGDLAVKFAPNMTIEKQAPGTAADAKPGKTVLVIGNATTALAIGVNM